MVQRAWRDALAESLRNRNGERINMVLCVSLSTVNPPVKSLGHYTPAPRTHPILSPQCQEEVS